jgi:cellulose synthase (UDP-forming)
MESPVSVMLPNDVLAEGDTTDLSSSGVRVQLAEPVELAPGQEVQIIFALREGKAALPVVVRGGEGSELRLQFGPLTLDQQTNLTEALYSRADSWLGWGESREVDRPLRSLARILKLSVQGFGIALGSLFPGRPRPKLDRAALASRISSLWLPALLLPGLLALPCLGASLPGQPPSQFPNQFPNQFHDQFTLRDAGVSAPIQLYGRGSSHTVDFSLSQMELTQKASLHVYYHLAPNHAGHAMRVLLNGTEVATLTAPPAADRTTLLQQEVSVPPELLVHQNQITFAFSGELLGPCRPTENLQPEGSIEPDTRLVLSGSLLAMANDLTRLPLPFLDPSSFRRSSLPVVFAGPPSHAALQAAGILASYFGMLAGDHQILFPVSIGQLPAGNAILIVENPDLLPPGLDIPWIKPETRPGSEPGTKPGSKSALVAIRSNPADPAGKLLVLAGNQVGQLVMAAQAVALHSPQLTADAPAIAQLTLPRARQPDDAPRWSRTDQPVALVNAADPAADNAAAQDGSVPVNVYLRLPPDLAYLNRDRVPLALEYRYNQVPLTNDSAAQVVVNQQYVGATLLPSGRNTARIVRGDMQLETSALRPFSNSLSMSFAFRFARRQLCQGNTQPGMTAALLTSSHLDLRGVPHWATLPDLELLANAGFPFTRYADLDRTTVVLPVHPAAGEIAVYLMLMGHFAAQTGYPALRVRVDGSEALRPGEDRDLLVIGGFEDGEDAIAGLAATLPLSFDGNGVDGDGVDVQRPERFLPRFHEAWDKFSGHSFTPPDTGPGHFSVMPDALIGGSESPYAAGHSLVLILLPSVAALPPQDAGSGGGTNGWMGDFLRVAQSSAISGSLSVAQGGHFYSYRLQPGSYHVGRLSWRLQVDRWLTQAPWSVPGGVLACCVPLALCTQGWLERRAAARLSGLER